MKIMCRNGRIILDGEICLCYNLKNGKRGMGMTAEEKKRLAEFERDIKKMQKDHKETFAEFELKKRLPRRIGDRLKSIFTPRSR